MDDRVQRDLGGRLDAADACPRPVPRPREDHQQHAGLRRQRVDPAGRRRSVQPGDGAATGLLHAVDPVQRLGPGRAAGPAGQQRPPLLPGRPRAALAHRARAAAARIRRSRRLGAHGDLGDGDRQPGSHRRPLSGGLPHEPGRQQAPDPGRPGLRTRAIGTSRSSAARQPTARTPATRPSRRRRGTRSSKTSTTTASWTSSSRKAT